MQAQVKRKAEPGLWLEGVPVPEVGDDDVLIRIRKTSICGTGVHIYNWDAWSQELRSPIVWEQVNFFFKEHLALTQDVAFTDNLLFILLEQRRR